MERKKKFTPGPWHILVPKPRYGNRKCHSIVDGGGGYVAKTVAVSVLRGISVVKREERKANEHLIAAAPEMYELLEQLYGVLVNVPVLQVEIEKVLKKARGEV